jgi:hypothetical protein
MNMSSIASSVFGGGGGGVLMAIIGLLKKALAKSPAGRAPRRL